MESQHQLAPMTRNKKSGLAAAAAQDGVLGRIVTVNGKIVVNTMPLPQTRVASLMKSLRAVSDDYGRYGLPLKVLYFQFSNSFLLGVVARFTTVLVWAETQANVSELEALARKVASTAHLKSGSTEDDPLWDFVRGVTLPSGSAALTSAEASTHPNITTTITIPHSIMNWKDATKSLEGILTKVLAQAQASKLIDKAMVEAGADQDGEFDLQLYGQIGRSLMEKIPHKVLRASLTKEFENSMSKMN